MIEHIVLGIFVILAVSLISANHAKGQKLWDAKGELGMTQRKLQEEKDMRENAESVRDSFARDYEAADKRSQAAELECGGLRNELEALRAHNSKLLAEKNSIEADLATEKKSNAALRGTVTRLKGGKKPAEKKKSGRIIPDSEGGL